MRTHLERMQSLTFSPQILDSIPIAAEHGSHLFLHHQHHLVKEPLLLARRCQQEHGQQHSPHRATGVV